MELMRLQMEMDELSTLLFPSFALATVTNQQMGTIPAPEAAQEEEALDGEDAILSQKKGEYYLVDVQ